MIFTFFKKARLHLYFCDEPGRIDIAHSARVQEKQPYVTILISDVKGVYLFHF